MKIYDFRRFLIRKEMTDEEIKTQLDNIRKIEKTIGTTIEEYGFSNSEIEEISKTLTWHVIPWKKKEYVASLNLYVSFLKQPKKKKKEDSSYGCKVCPICGKFTPNGSVYCEQCGNKIGKTNYIALNEIGDTASAHKGIVFALIGVVLAVVGCFAFLYVTSFEIPNVVDLYAMDAIETLVETGVNEDSIELEIDGETISKDEMERDEFLVVSQDPVSGTKIHSDDDVVLECEDMKVVRGNNIKRCVFLKNSEAASIAEENGYEHSTEMSSNTEDENLYVIELKNQDDEDRIVSFVLGDENKLKSAVKKYAEKYIGKNFEKLESIEEETGCKYEFVDIGKKSVDIESIDKTKYQITKYYSFDIEEKTILFYIDTNKHIKELKQIESLKEDIPYEGMKEKYIDMTGAGKHDESSDEGDGSTRYIWKAKDGNIVLVVECINKKVTNVTKQNEEIYWKADLPDYNASKAEYEAQKAQLEANAKAYAARVRDDFTVYVTSTGTYHIDGCTYWEYGSPRRYGSVRNSCKPCNLCTPDTYCERDVYGSALRSYYQEHGEE